MLLRARIVYPVSSPPIDDGAVVIQNDKILEVGRFRDLSSSDPDQTDLGEVVLMPGLINSHCHLDYTGMAGLIPPPSDFIDWIEAIIAIKASWDYSDYAASWLEGANQLLTSGVTTVADMEAVPELIPEVTTSTALRVHTFMELLAIRKRQTLLGQVAEAEAKLTTHPASKGGSGLAPHALYSTYPSLLQVAACTADSNGWPLSIHLSESASEDEMFREGRGRMFNWLHRNGREMSDCRGSSPIQLLDELKLLNPRLLAVHCNYVDSADVELLGKNRVHVIHCPNSHEYFGHRKFPAEELREAGANLCLGTDSLASTRKKKGAKPTLNLFDEMRLFTTRHPEFTAEEILKMATTNGAEALGKRQFLGEFAPDGAADLVVLPVSPKLEQAAQGVLESTTEPHRVMVAGQWISPDPQDMEKSG